MFAGKFLVAGPSGSISIGSSTATAGHGGSISIGVGSGSGGNGGDLTLAAGATTAVNPAVGGAVSLLVVLVL